MKHSPRVLRQIFAILVALCMLRSAPTARVPEFDAFFGFGDSLADIGNVFLATTALGLDPAAPPSVSPNQTYFGGRFSNGPISFEYLWLQISGQAPGTPGALLPSLAAPVVTPTSAVNFAFGGTGADFQTITPGGFAAPGLRGQIEMLRAALGGAQPSPNALFAIVTGANDYRDDAFVQPSSPFDVVGNIVEGVLTLHAMGARTVMVLSLPDLGLVPANAANAQEQSRLTRKHNQLLENALRQVDRFLPTLNVIYVDINAVIDLLPASMDKTTPALDVLFPPEQLPPGFRMSLCLFIDPATCADVPTFDVGFNFMFWDVVHPTTAVHQMIGDYLYQSIPR